MNSTGKTSRRFQPRCSFCTSRGRGPWTSGPNLLSPAPLLSVPHSRQAFFLFRAVPVAYGSFQARGQTELKPPACPTTTAGLALSCLCAACSCSPAGPLTHRARAGIRPASSQTRCQVANLLSHSGPSQSTSQSAFRSQGSTRQCPACFLPHLEAPFLTASRTLWS